MVLRVSHRSALFSMRNVKRSNGTVFNSCSDIDNKIAHTGKLPIFSLSRFHFIEVNLRYFSLENGEFMFYYYNIHDSLCLEKVVASHMIMKNI